MIHPELYGDFVIECNKIKEDYYQFDFTRENVEKIATLRLQIRAYRELAELKEKYNLY